MRNVKPAVFVQTVIRLSKPGRLSGAYSSGTTMPRRVASPVGTRLPRVSIRHRRSLVVRQGRERDRSSPRATPAGRRSPTSPFPAGSPIRFPRPCVSRSRRSGRSPGCSARPAAALPGVFPFRRRPRPFPWPHRPGRYRPSPFSRSDRSCTSKCADLPKSPDCVRILIHGPAEPAERRGIDPNLDRVGRWDLLNAGRPMEFDLDSRALLPSRAVPPATGPSVSGATVSADRACS